MAEQQIIDVELQKSIDTSAVERDVQGWDAQALVLKNTGICREGGVTNLGAKVGLDSDYEETYYCSNGSKAQLKRDVINLCYHAFADGREVGIMPLWGVKERRQLPGNAADVLATSDNTLLLLYFSASLATIEEVNIDTLARIRIKSFAIPSQIAYITFVRPKVPTWATVKSIAGYSITSTSTTKTITGYIISDGGVTVFSGNVTCAVNSNPISIHAYYEHGWLLEVDVWNTNVSQNLWMIKTDGTSSQISGGFQTKALIGDYKLSDNTITYKCFADKYNQIFPFAGVTAGNPNWRSITSDPSGNIWVCVAGGDIYKCPPGSTTFTAIGGTGRNWTGICSDPSGNIWACVTGGDIYKCPFGSTTFTGIGGTVRAWSGICSDPRGNIWACTTSLGDIFRCWQGTTNFVAILGPAKNWAGVAADSNGTIWAAEATGGGGDIYKCPGGTIGNTTFTAIGGTLRLWAGICVDLANNVWALAGTVIYKCISGSTSFVSIGSAAPVRACSAICADIYGNMWTVAGFYDIYLQNNQVTTYGFLITPPASDGLAWAYSALTDSNITSTTFKQILTFGGYGINHSSGAVSFFNHKSARDWTTYQLDVPEIYGNIWPELTDFALKLHTIAGLASYLSASFNVDGIGAPLTEVGEVSPYYLPQSVKLDTNNYLLVYQRGDNGYGLIKISRDVYSRMQEISPGIVKTNTFSGMNIIDTIRDDIKMGGNPFNGFAIVGYPSLDQSGSYVARHRGLYGGSVDTGYKNNTATHSGTAVLIAIPESVQYTKNNELIDIFSGLPPSSLNYIVSIASGVAQVLNNVLIGTLYVDDQVIPPPIGSEYSDRSIKLVATTAIREQDYDGYQLGNELLGRYGSFVLYGNIYFVDTAWIRGIAVSSGNLIQSANKIAPVQGLRFLAASPQEGFFASDFDNSLYSFNGGQSVDKKQLFNRKETIRAGAYSVIENTLALITDTSVIFIRDGVITETPTTFGTTPELFPTVDGIWLSSGGYSIRYVFNLAGISTGGPVAVLDIVDGGGWGTAYPDALDGGSWGAGLDVVDGGVWGSSIASDMIINLLWQTKYLGMSNRAIQMIDRYLIRLYKEDKAQAKVTITFEYSTEQKQEIETRDFTIGDIAHPWDSEGYAFIEFHPKQKRSIAASLGIESPEKILILSVMATLSGDGISSVTNR